MILEMLRKSKVHNLEFHEKKLANEAFGPDAREVIISVTKDEYTVFFSALSINGVKVNDSDFSPTHVKVETANGIIINEAKNSIITHGDSLFIVDLQGEDTGGVLMQLQKLAYRTMINDPLVVRLLIKCKDSLIPFYVEDSLDKAIKEFKPLLEAKVKSSNLFSN